MSEFEFNFQNNEEIISYAKLEGPNFKKFIHKLTIYLGREPDSDRYDNSEDQCIFIGDSQKISRRHAKISWNFENGNWEIQILSKNKAIINGVTLRNIDNAQVLPHKSAIKIDRYKFYFFPAINERENVDEF